MPKRFVAHRPKPRAKPRPKPVPVEPAAGRTLPKGAHDPGGGASRPKEIGGPSGPEPTRYGDWERKGICVDF